MNYFFLLYFGICFFREICHNQLAEDKTLSDGLSTFHDPKSGNKITPNPIPVHKLFLIMPVFQRIIPRKTGYHKNSFFYFQKTSPPLYPGSMLLSSQVSNPQSLCLLCHLRALCVITKLELHTSVKCAISEQ